MEKKNTTKIKGLQIAVKTSQLEDEIAFFPRRDNAAVGNRGPKARFRGKATLASIARALVKKPQLLILDITASLDAENEEKTLASTAGKLS